MRNHYVHSSLVSLFNEDKDISEDTDIAMHMDSVDTDMQCDHTWYCAWCIPATAVTS